MVAMAITAAIGLYGASKAAKASKNAARAQEAGQQAAIKESRRQYNQNRADYEPFREAGLKSLAAYNDALGLNGEAARDASVENFQTTPGYQFQVDEGEKGITNNLSALGMRNSGAALKAITRFRTNIANNEFGNYLSRLSGGANSGQTATAQNASTGTALSGNISNGLANVGATRASGYVGAANALNAGLGQLGNAIGQGSSKINNFFKPGVTDNWAGLRTV